MTKYISPLTILFAVFFSDAVARPCYPSDPTGNNSGNLCPITPASGIHSNSFVEGNARPIRAIPSIANPSGRILLRPKGFWTKVETKGQTRRVRSSRDQIYILKK